MEGEIIDFLGNFSGLFISTNFILSTQTIYPTFRYKQISFSRETDFSSNTEILILTYLIIVSVGSPYDLEETGSGTKVDRSR